MRKPSHRPKGKASADTDAGTCGAFSFFAMAITHEVRMTDEGGGILRIMLNDERMLVLRIECDLPGSESADFHISPDELEVLLNAIKYVGNG